MAAVTHTEFSGNEFRGNSSAFRYISPEQVFIERLLRFSA
jgi:nitrous oxidase accessory protein NosD